MAHIYVCRTCLEVIQSPSMFVSLDGSSTKSVEIKSKLEACVPEMTITTVRDPIICGRCLISLNASYEFKRKCIATEEEIYSYLFDTNTDVLDLQSIAKECSNSNLHFNANEIIKEEIKVEVQDNEIKVEEKEDYEDFSCITVKEEDITLASQFSESDYTTDCTNLFTDNFNEFSMLPANAKQLAPFFNLEGQTENQITALPKCSVVLTRLSDDSLRNASVVDMETNDNVQHQSELPKEFPKISKHLKLPYKGRVAIKKHSDGNDVCYVCYPYNLNTTEPMKIETRMKTSDEKSYQCGVCGYTSAFKLHVHMRIHTGEKPHKCDICGFATAYSNTLKMHFEAHLKNKSHFCSYCEFQANSFLELSAHMSNHPGCKVYKCEQCEYSTNNLKDLKYHHWSHTDKRVYECATCGFKTCSKFTLENHVKVHSNGKTYHCTKCHFSTVYQSSLNKHLKMHYANDEFY